MIGPGYHTWNTCNIIRVYKVNRWKDKIYNNTSRLQASHKFVWKLFTIQAPVSFHTRKCVVHPSRNVWRSAYNSTVFFVIGPFHWSVKGNVYLAFNIAR